MEISKYAITNITHSQNNSKKRTLLVSPSLLGRDGRGFLFPFFYYLCTYYDTDITHTGAAKAKDAVADRILFRERSLS